MTLKQVGLYAQNEITVGNWRGSLALRHDWTEQTGTGYGGTVIDQSDNATSGRVG